VTSYQVDVGSARHLAAVIASDGAQVDASVPGRGGTAEPTTDAASAVLVQTIGAELHSASAGLAAKAAAARFAATAYERSEWAIIRSVTSGRPSTPAVGVRVR
jgi:hypothetical protein